jgi:hypothetical protein
MRAQRGVFLDLNRIGLQLYDPITGKIPLDVAAYDLPPFSASPYSIKQGLQKASAIQEGGCSRQSICKIQRGVATGATETSTSYLLDRKVPSTVTVKLWRPRPYFPDRTPININTALFYTSVTENPRFHVISPCFATAKIWKDKSTDTVFVDIEKGRKCNVSSCQQPSTPSFKIPYVSDIPYIGGFANVPSLGLSSEDTPNYCYADEEYIWGGDLSSSGDQPDFLKHMGIFSGCTGTCAIGSAITGVAGLRACIKGCEYVDLGALYADATIAAESFTGASYKRQETGWGYWNFQKANDICDWIDFIGSTFGSFEQPMTQTEKIQEAQKLKDMSKLQKLENSAKNFINPTTHFSAGDLCYGLTLMGDTALSWPIKTTPQDVWRKAAILDDQCMQKSAAACVWTTKCFADTDCNQALWCDMSVNECRQGCRTSPDSCASLNPPETCNSVTRQCG